MAKPLRILAGNRVAVEEATSKMMGDDYDDDAATGLVRQSTEQEHDADRAGNIGAAETSVASDGKMELALTVRVRAEGWARRP